jgi:hypothetical protein
LIPAPVSRYRGACPHHSDSIDLLRKSFMALNSPDFG